VLHRDRRRAESFGADPRRYDRARPRYPTEMVERILARSPGLDVLDVGCGTGIAARQFQAAGCRVLGVEVDPRMAAVARRNGVDVEEAPFEEWDPAGRSFDAVVAGQAWHWIDPVGGAVKAARILRPGGRLAVFWNVGAPSPEVAEAFTSVYRKVMPGLDEYSVLLGYGGPDRFATGSEGMRAAGLFDEPEQWRFEWQRPYTRDEWLDQLPTHSDHSVLPPHQLDALMAAIGDVIDGLGGCFTMRYAAVVVTAVRAG
jgi:SAM-dependent methyltransferase